MKSASLAFLLFSNLLCAIGAEWDCDDSIPCMSRYSFPSTCERHFSDNTTTKGFWIEAEDTETLTRFSKYLSLIPRQYTADCYHCLSCNGVRFCLYRGFECPANDSRDTLFKLHRDANRASIKEDCASNIDHCESLCWNGGYFRRWNHQYIHFFEHFLHYSSENEQCYCYWPELDEDAANLNQDVYELLRDFCDRGILTPEFSSYWNAVLYWYYYDFRDTDDGYEKIKKIQSCSTIKPNAHGIASSLTTYTFFYSQYRQMLLDVTAFIEKQDSCSTDSIDRVYDTLNRVKNVFYYQYNYCLKKHPHPKIYYERGMLNMHSGHYEEALADIRELMRLAKGREDSRLTSEMYQQEGAAYAEIGMYDKAIESLNQAILKDPNNYEAYFERAAAYFELGDFDRSIEDYLTSKKSNNYTHLPSDEFVHAFSEAAVKASLEAAREFIPSLCHTVYGLGKCLWAFGEAPVASIKNLAAAGHEIGESIADYLLTIDKETLNECVSECRELYQRYNKLSDKEQGELVGYTIGKYGVEIFAGGALLKSVSLCKKLKSANQICNYESILLSQPSKKSLAREATQHYAARKKFFESSKIHWDKQNKHIPGSHNFENGKSYITIDRDKLGLLVNEHKGKGEWVNSKPLQYGFRERIDFGTIIGEYVVNKKSIPTTVGIIHYDAKGFIHVVPARPIK